MIVGGIILTLLEGILEKLETKETVAEQKLVIFDYLGKANEDRKYYLVLEELSDVLFRRGQIDLAFSLLMEMYAVRKSSIYATKIVKRLYQYEDYERAYYQWLERAKISNDKLDILLYEAKLLNKLNFKTEAVELYKQLIKMDPTFSEAYKDLADLLMEQGNYQEAETYYRAIYEYLIDFDDIRDVRMRLVQLESWKEIFNLERIKELEYDPNLPVETEEEYYLFANVYASLHQYEVAIDYAKKALQKDRNNINYSLRLIELYNIVGQESNLVKELAHVARALPEYDPVIIKIAQVAFNSDYLSEEIVDKLMSYSSLIDNYEDAYLVAQIVVNHYLKKNDPATALFKTRIINENLLEEEYLSYNYAKIYEALNNYEMTEEYYQIALDNLLPDEDLVFDFVNYYYKTNQIDQAIAMADKYANTVYDNEKLKLLRKEMFAKEKAKMFKKQKKWE